MIVQLAEAVKASPSPQRRRFLARLTFRARQTPALPAYQKAEIEKWWPMIKAVGIKAQRGGVITRLVVAPSTTSTFVTSVLPAA
jgi:hypothetical protein